MDAQAHLALPARGDDGRGTFAGQHGGEQRGADVDVAEVEGAHDVDVAGDDEALHVSADQEREVAFDGHPFEVAERDISAGQGDARPLRRHPFQRDRAAGDDGAAADLGADGIDVDAIFAEDDRAGDVVDRLREAGQVAQRCVLELRGAGERRRAECAAHAAGDEEVAVRADRRHEELEQRRFERAAQVDIDALRAGQLDEAGHAEGRAGVAEGELEIVEDDAAVAQRRAQRARRTELVVADAHVELREGGVDAHRFERRHGSAELQLRDNGPRRRKARRFRRERQRLGQIGYLQTNQPAEGAVRRDAAVAFDDHEIADRAVHDQPSIVDGDLELRRRRVRREVESLNGGLIERRGELELRLRQRAAARRFERDVAAEDPRQRREQLEFREIEIARRDGIGELIRLEVDLRLAGDRAARRDDGHVRRLQRPLRELNVRGGGGHRLAVDRAVAYDDGAVAFEFVLRTLQMQRAGEIAGDRHLAQVEEGNDVRNRIVVRGDVEVEAFVALARMPCHGAVEAQVALGLVHVHPGEGELPFLWRAGDDEASRADAVRDELEVDDGDGAVDRIVDRLHGQIEARGRAAIGKRDRAGHG